MNKLYVIFGGSFNPIHYGHIYFAKALIKKIPIKKILFLPNNKHPNKKTKISIIDKLNMIKLSIENNSFFHISYLESKKNVFYTIDTLKKIRKNIGQLEPLCFIMGYDNLQNLNLWKDWKSILLFSHLLILPRKCVKNSDLKLEKWINYHRINNAKLLINRPCGSIFFLNEPMVNINSTQIRNNYYTGKSSIGLVPLSVDRYIQLKNLYRKQQ